MVLTEETRIRWIQTQNSAEALFSKIKGVVNSGVYRAEEALNRLSSLVSGGCKGSVCVDDVKSGWEETKDAFQTSAESAEDVVGKAKEKLDEKVKFRVKSEL